MTTDFSPSSICSLHFNNLAAGAAAAAAVTALFTFLKSYFQEHVHVYHKLLVSFAFDLEPLKWYKWFECPEKDILE